MIFNKHNYQYFERVVRLKNSNRSENNSTNMKKIFIYSIHIIRKGFQFCYI